MRFRYTESFPEECEGAEATLRIIRKIVEDRLAEEIIKRLPRREQQSDIA